MIAFFDTVCIFKLSSCAFTVHTGNPCNWFCRKKCRCFSRIARSQSILAQCNDGEEAEDMKLPWKLGELLSPKTRLERMQPKSRTPGEESPCICGTGRVYKRCCRPYHIGEAEPRSAVELLRARFSAYAYRLPKYIMGTTHMSNEDWTSDRLAWEKSILEFCDQYSFVRLDILENKIAGPDTSYILFRLLEQGEPVSFIERSKFLKDRNRWYYASGRLVDIERGF
eukprot:jgi/Galph1/283/GphlegSOOS_G5067.1